MPHTPAFASQDALGGGCKVQVACRADCCGRGYSCWGTLRPGQQVVRWHRQHLEGTDVGCTGRHGEACKAHGVMSFECTYHAQGLGDGDDAHRTPVDGPKVSPQLIL